MASRREPNFLPYRLAVFELPQRPSVGALSQQLPFLQQAQGGRRSGERCQTKQPLALTPSTSQEMLTGTCVLMW